MKCSRCDKELTKKDSGEFCNQCIEQVIALGKCLCVFTPDEARRIIDFLEKGENELP
jgi:hypothetical protein